MKSHWSVCKSVTKTITLALNFALESIDTWHVCSLWQDLSDGTMLWLWPWPLTYFKVKFVAEQGTTILWICLLLDKAMGPKIFKMNVLCPALIDQYIDCILILILSCLFVCCQLLINFWTVRDRDFIFCMHIQIMIHIQMTPRSMTLSVTFMLNISFQTLLPVGHSISQIHLVLSLVFP